MISSYKAVRPTNSMGTTKSRAELIIHQFTAEALGANKLQRFTAARFGNVLGSIGSVVPLLKEQIEKGVPVTVSDLKMSRPFMSIHEASDLIVYAGALSEGGEVFRFDMSEPIYIKNPAKNMLQLAGIEIRADSHPDGDVEIVVTGKRQGGKMYEELFYHGSEAKRTTQPRIRRSKMSQQTTANLHRRSVPRRMHLIKK